MLAGILLFAVHLLNASVPITHHSVFSLTDTFDFYEPKKNIVSAMLCVENKFESDGPTLFYNQMFKGCDQLEDLTKDILLVIYSMRQTETPRRVTLESYLSQWRQFTQSILDEFSSVESLHRLIFEGRSKVTNMKQCTWNAPICTNENRLKQVIKWFEDSSSLGKHVDSIAAHFMKYKDVKQTRLIPSSDKQLASLFQKDASYGPLVCIANLLRDKDAGAILEMFQKSFHLPETQAVPMQLFNAFIELYFEKSDAELQDFFKFADEHTKDFEDAQKLWRSENETHALNELLRLIQEAEVKIVNKLVGTFPSSTIISTLQDRVVAVHEEGGTPIVYEINLETPFSLEHELRPSDERAIQYTRKMLQNTFSQLELFNTTPLLEKVCIPKDYIMKNLPNPFLDTSRLEIDKTLIGELQKVNLAKRPIMSEYVPYAYLPAACIRYEYDHLDLVLRSFILQHKPSTDLRIKAYKLFKDLETLKVIRLYPDRMVTDIGGRQYKYFPSFPYMFSDVLYHASMSSVHVDDLGYQLNEKFKIVPSVYYGQALKKLLQLYYDLLTSRNKKNFQQVFDAKKIMNDFTTCTPKRISHKHFNVGREFKIEMDCLAKLDQDMADRFLSAELQELAKHPSFIELRDLLSPNYCDASSMSFQALQDLIRKSKDSFFEIMKLEPETESSTGKSSLNQSPNAHNGHTNTSQHEANSGPEALVSRKAGRSSLSMPAKLAIGTVIVGLLITITVVFGMLFQRHSSPRNVLFNK